MRQTCSYICKIGKIGLQIPYFFGKRSRGLVGTVFHLFYRFCDGGIHVIVCRKTAVNRFHAAFV